MACLPLCMCPSVGHGHGDTCPSYSQWRTDADKAPLLQRQDWVHSVWNLINANIQIQSTWISAKTARPRVCTRSPDWILMISVSWKVSGSLSQHHYWASSCRGRRRKSSVSDCGRGPQHSLHMYQVKHIRRAGRRATEEAAAGLLSMAYREGTVYWTYRSTGCTYGAPYSDMNHTEAAVSSLCFNLLGVPGEMR